MHRVQRILSTYNSGARTNKGSCFRYDHDSQVWTLSSSKDHDHASSTPGHNSFTPPQKKMPSFHLSRNTSMTTTTTMTPTPSLSSLSMISSAAGSSLTAGIMEQVSTWRTGADTDDDDEASLEIYSNPSLNRLSFPSQTSRDDSYASGGSLLNGMEIMPTLHQLQFPQPDDNGLFHQGSQNDIMPPPSSTTSSYRRHSMSSHQQRPGYGRIKRSSQDDNTGDQFVPTASRASYHAMTADILARGARQTESRAQVGMATMTDRVNESIFGHTPPNKSSFPSPRTSTPSPRVQSDNPFGQPTHAGSMRGDHVEAHHRHPSGHSGQLRHSPNQFDTPRLRPNRRSTDELVDEDEPMLRETPRPVHAPSPRFTKEDPRLRDLGATLQKSLSFNGEDEYDEGEDEEEPIADLEQSRVRPGRHHPYLARPRATSSQPYPPGRRQPLERGFRDRKGKGRANGREDEDQEIAGKTPLLLNAINTSQTNILSELQNVQRINQEEISHFREEIYKSLQVAFTRLANQVEGVGRAVVSAETTQQETVKQLGQSIGSAMGDVFSKMTETIQQQIQQQYQQQQQQQQHSQYQHYHPYGSRPPSIRHSSPFPVGQSQPQGPSGSSSSYGVQGLAGSRHSISGVRDSSYWKRDSDQPHDQGDEDDEEEDNGRGKRRAVERPRSTSGSRRTINRSRGEFEH
ncbi:hypothetical protein BGX28_003136 [Mortierella sp. GBA30]|nr:hypothetical protein BGX28_003136 [Mortierella sp. GBA30]